MLTVIKAFLEIVTCISLIFLPLPERQCNPEFNGTFIQSWMSSSWDDERWQKEFDVMEQAGIEYLIIQDIASKSTDGSWTLYYNSALPVFDNADRSGSDVIEAALKNSRGHNIKIFVGLGLFDNWWTTAGFGDEYSDFCDISSDMIKEIHQKYGDRYSDAFYGWYFTPEISNGPQMKLSTVQIAKGINRIIDAINETDSDRPLLLSPFYTQFGANPSIESAKLTWAAFIKAVNFRPQDILCPQDAVGAGWTLEENLINVWRMYSQAVKLSEKDIHLWANCENFTSYNADSVISGWITPFPSENRHYVTATLDRFCRQMDIASRYVENIITFSYNHYYSPEYVDPMFHNTYLDYIENGHVLESEAPSVPTDFCATPSDNGTQLRWEPSSDNFGVAYYRICKNGNFLVRIEYFEDTEFTDPDYTAGAVYTITAYDAAGNASADVEITA